MIKKEILQAVSKQIKTEFKGSLGRCQRITERAQVLLAEHGIDTTIIKGEAAFRVGNSELANVAFLSETYGMQVFGHPDNLFHYWLKDDAGRILDFSTFTLKDVVAMLDKQEGIKKPTKVTWCPDYLYVSYSECVSQHKVRFSRNDKLFFYKPSIEMYLDLMPRELPQAGSL